MQTPGFLPRPATPEALLFYPKTVALYDITYLFAHKYIKAGDRTRDQMIQAARSGKQNIIEGAADGMTSSKMEITLTNCARGSLKELQADYEDYLRANNLTIWDKNHPRTPRLNQFCRSLKQPEKYAATWQKMTDEELANLSLTLIHQATTLIEGYLKMLEKRFLTQGGFSENMAKARLAQRSPA
ncbi:MAG: four helix bundle suffix domain-containing protein [Prevotella sp.]|nr:four helix bundle suffix domain-containing protein [Prevotella sp.]